jgi:predicted O-methyltransferase YrrM
MSFTEDWYNDEQCRDLVRLQKETASLQGDVIEIGCWEGKSAAHLANSCHPDILICNDTWLGNVAESVCTGVEHTTQQILKERDVYSTFVRNMNSLTRGNYTVVKRDCLEWLREYSGSIKFIHIDASHEYESVYETIQLALPKMVPGSVMCGDDYLSAHLGRADLHGGVERAVTELLPGHRNLKNLWFWKKGL